MSRSGGGTIKPLLLAAALLGLEFLLVAALPGSKAVPLAAGVVGGFAHLFLLSALSEARAAVVGGDTAGWLEVGASALLVAFVSFMAHPVCSTVA
jgi:hypothetical protein